jgi:hypothetical protein
MPLKNVSKGCLYRMARYIAVSHIPHEIYCCVYLTRYIAVYTSTGILLYRMSLKNVSKGCLYRMARYIEMYCCPIECVLCPIECVLCLSRMYLKDVSIGWRDTSRYIAVYTSRDISRYIPQEIYCCVYLTRYIAVYTSEIYCCVYLTRYIAL